ncbi:unnamed protein product [Meganyctiphanes norvegica]|uniref:Uncharacterized protein n=1 Tax=Meganyctiphanes norvegica TaxID=48144 RepID=A0AAV2RXY1_MEGNR
MNGVSLLVSAIIAVYIVDCHNLHDEPGGRNPLDEAQQASDLVRKGHQDPDSAGGTQPLKKTVNVDDSGEKYKQQKEKHLTMTNIQEPHKKEVKERKTFALERSHCRIKSICFVAGGHCVDDPALCNGRLTPQYCAGRNCQCCVPDMLDKLQSIDSKLDEMIEHQVSLMLSLLYYHMCQS